MAAAKVVDNAACRHRAAAVRSSPGMIVHSLKYRSPAVTGLAYFIAFATLAISEVTTFSVIALIPLAASLLYVASRNSWDRFAIFGLVATYVTCGLHKDTGAAALADSGAIPDLLAGLRSLRPDARRCLAAAVERARLPAAIRAPNGRTARPRISGSWRPGRLCCIWAARWCAREPERWRPAVLLNAALATTAIVLKLHSQWVPLALLFEAELYYLAGVRFRSVVSAHARRRRSSDWNWPCC